jgi:hypothetical protein
MLGSAILKAFPLEVYRTLNKLDRQTEGLRQRVPNVSHRSRKQINSDHPKRPQIDAREPDVPCLQMCFLPRLQEPCKGKVISALVVDSTCGPQIHNRKASGAPIR